MLEINSEEKILIDRKLNSHQKQQIKEIVYLHFVGILNMCRSICPIEKSSELFINILNVLINDFKRRQLITSLKNLNPKIDAQNKWIQGINKWLQSDVAFLLHNTQLLNANADVKTAVLLYVKDLLFDEINHSTSMTVQQKPLLNFQLLQLHRENAKEKTAKKEQVWPRFLSNTQPLRVERRTYSDLSESASVNFINDIEEYFLQTDLQEYQRKSVTNLVINYYNNLGTCLFSDIQGESFSQTVGVLKFLFPYQSLTKPFLIIAPEESVNKWKKKLCENMQFYSGEIFEVTVSNLDSQLPHQIKIIITTTTVLVHALKDPGKNCLKRVCDVVSLSDLIDLDESVLLNWNDVRNKLTDLIYFPSETLLTGLCLTHGIEYSLLKTLVAIQVFCNRLKDKGYLSPEGITLEKFYHIDKVEKLFKTIPEFELSIEKIFYKLQQLWKEGGLSGIIVSDPTVLKKENYCLFEYLIKKIKIEKGLRLFFDENVNNNTLDRLTLINDFLNGVPFSQRMQSINSFKKDLVALGKKIVELDPDLNTQGSSKTANHLNEEIITIQEKLNNLLHYYAMRQLYCSQEIVRPNPTQVELEVKNWLLSREQNEGYRGIHENMIEQVYRGFSFFLKGSAERIKNSYISNKQILNCVQRLLDHPILVSKEHITYLNNMKSFQSQCQYLREIIDKVYGSNVTDFISKSGKLLTFKNKITDILKENNSAKIIVVTEYLSSAAIVQVLFDRVFPEIETVFFNPKTAAAKFDVNEFNDNRFSSKTNKAFILCSDSHKKIRNLNANYFIFFDDVWISQCQQKLFNLVLHPKNPFKKINRIHFLSNSKLDISMAMACAEKKSWNDLFIFRESKNTSWLLNRLRGFIMTSPFFENLGDLSDAILQLKGKASNNETIEKPANQTLDENRKITKRDRSEEESGTIQAVKKIKY